MHKWDTVEKLSSFQERWLTDDAFRSVMLVLLNNAFDQCVIGLV